EGRRCLRGRVLRPDRRGADAAAPARSARCLYTAAGQQPVRCLPGRLPRADRHPRPAAAPAGRRGGPGPRRAARTRGDRGLEDNHAQPAPIRCKRAAGRSRDAADRAQGPHPPAAPTTECMDPAARFPHLRAKIISRAMGRSKRVRRPARLVVECWSACATKPSARRAIMDFSFITIILQLICLECILSIDNAAVMGAMVAHLPADQPTPWPTRLRRLLGWSDRFLGSQQAAALKVGLFGAYAGRALMLVLAAVIIQMPWVHILGALYLLYLGIDFFAERYYHGPDEDQLKAQ